jgi:hypothetical protein
VIRDVLRRALWGLGAALLPAAGGAQPAFEIEPSLGFMQLYDDNLFARPRAAENDLVTRLSPRLDARYRSRSLSAAARYTFDAELYRKHPELNTPAARQEAAFEVRHRTTRRLSLALAGSYATTLTPGDFNVVSGLEAGRARAQRRQVLGTLTLRLGPFTSAVLDPAFTRETVTGSAATNELAAGLGLQRRLGPSSSGRLGYRRRRFTSGGAADTTHVLSAGWSGTLGAGSTIELLAGPRFGAGGVDAEASLAWRRRLRGGELMFTYLRTQATALGQAGPLSVDGLGAAFRHQAARGVRVALEPGISWSRGEGFAAVVYRAGFDLAWRLTRRLTLAAGHQFSLQRGGAGAGGGEDVSHHTVRLGIVSGT